METILNLYMLCKYIVYIVVSNYKGLEETADSIWTPGCGHASQPRVQPQPSAFSLITQLDHLELFAGDMSVTKGEMQALGVAQICFFPTSGLEQFI